MFFVHISDGTIFINEFLANGIVDPDSEWIELYNSGSSNFDLISWKISDTSGTNFTFNATIPSNSFVILTRNVGFFNLIYPIVNTSGIKIINITKSGFELRDSDGEVKLYNSSGQLVDLIDYIQSSGKAFENISIGRYPDGSASIYNLSTMTPGFKNDNQAPTLNKWIAPSSNDTKVNGSFNIEVNITDDTTQVVLAILNLNGTNYSTTKNGDLWSYSWDTTLYAQISYNLTIFYNDSYGRAGSDSLINITVKNSNTIPKLVDVNLTNSDFLNRTNGTLQFAWSFIDDDGDSISASELLWYINGTLVLSYINSTSINPLFTTKLENWIVSIRVFDGANWSNFMNSSAMRITNSKPSLYVQNLAVSIQENQIVNITFNATDIDNDTLTFSSNKSSFSILGNSLFWNTDSSSSGNYTINLTVNDGNDIDSALINVTVIDIESSVSTSSNQSSTSSVALAGSGGAATSAFVCNYDWKCTEWSTCKDDTQTRSCEFVKIPQHAQDTECATSSSNPLLTQKCKNGTEIKETCEDGLQNQDEEGIDCGGICKPCPSEETENITQEEKNNSTNKITGFSVKDFMGSKSWIGTIGTIIVFSGIGIFYGIRRYNRNKII